MKKNMKYGERLKYRLGTVRAFIDPLLWLVTTCLQCFICLLELV